MKNTGPAAILLIAFLPILFYAGCSDSGNGTPDENTGLQPKWNGENGIGALFSISCNDCHTTGSEADFNVSEYDSVMAGGRVIPGDPDNSILVKRLEGDPGYMPPGDPLDQEDITVIRQWITDGAQDN